MAVSEGQKGSGDGGVGLDRMSLGTNVWQASEVRNVRGARLIHTAHKP